MSSNLYFSKFDVSTLVLQKPKTNAGGQGKSAWIDRKDRQSSNFTSETTLLWPIRPGDEKIKENERLNIEITCNSEEEKVARDCDAFFLNSIFEMKSEFFPSSKAKSITSVDALKPMYKNLLREGGEGKDGRRYANSFRLKVDGWSQYISNVNVQERTKADGEKIKVIKDCSWNTRPVSERTAPSARDTRFYLLIGNTDGRPKYTDKVPIMLDGKIVKDSENKTVWRFVGPQDAMPGCKLSVVWQISKIYITETTGPTAAAKEVYITPGEKKSSKQGLDGVDIEEVDDETAARALMHNEEDKADEVKEVKDVKEEIVKEEIKEEVVERVGEKRSSSSPAHKSKKIKTVAVEEDF